MRNTKQKEATINALRELGHATAKEIHALGQAKCPGLGLATVYRILSDEAREGRIRHVTLAGAGDDVFDITVLPHSHVQCHQCGQVFDLPSPNYAPLLKEAKRLGIIIDQSECCLGGLCKECASQN